MNARWHLRIAVAVALVASGAAGQAQPQPQPPKEPAKEKEGAKKGLAVADLKGEWVDSQDYNGAMVILTITFGGDGSASYRRVALLGGGKFESDITSRSTKVEKREGKDVIKLLDGTYQCYLSKEGDLDLTLVDGRGPKSWSFGRVKDKK